jgi:hypothetical protein
MKVAVVGAGSTYTPELVDGLVRMQSLLPVADPALMDVDEGRLDVLAAMTQRMLDRGGHPARVKRTRSLDDAVEGRTPCSCSCASAGRRRESSTRPCRSAAGASARRRPASAASRRRCGRCRWVLGIADRVRELAPDAWFLDFTNPVGIVAKALLDEGHRAVGLCSAAMGLPAPLREGARRRARAGRARPRRPQPSGKRGLRLAAEVRDDPAPLGEALPTSSWGTTRPPTDRSCSAVPAAAACAPRTPPLPNVEPTSRGSPS